MKPGSADNGSTWGPGTRAVHAGLPAAERGQPLLPGPAMASLFHLPGDAAPEGYARYANPTWTLLEHAIGALEGGEALVFGSGMAAITAVALARMRPGGAVVVPSDGYPGLRRIAMDRLEPLGVEVRYVPTDTAAVCAAADGADAVWVESPSNPLLTVCDIRAVAEAAHAAGALLIVDNTVPTPLGQRPLELGADVSVAAATKSLAGHSDLLLGYVASRDAELLAAVRSWRDQTGGVAGPFEAWLTHRSLATLDLRLERQSRNALALAEMLRGRDDVSEVRHPADDPVAARQMRRFGALVSFTLDSAERAQRFLAACRLVADATSFGGVHSTAERRARWGDPVPEGFIRLSAGCEDPEDLLSDVSRALDHS